MCAESLVKQIEELQQKLAACLVSVGIFGYDCRGSQARCIEPEQML